MKHEPCSEEIVLRVAPTLRDEIERAASMGAEPGQADPCGFWHKADIPVALSDVRYWG